MKDAKGPVPAPACSNCHGTGVDLGDMGGLARVVQACHCVKGGTSEERELWAAGQVLGWRQGSGDRLKLAHLSKERAHLLGMSERTPEQDDRLQAVTMELRPLLDRLGLTIEEQDLSRRMMDYIRSRIASSTPPEPRQKEDAP